MCVLLFGSFLRGPRRRGPVGRVGRAGTVPVGTVRVCAPRLMWRGRWSWLGSATRAGRECSTGQWDPSVRARPCGGSARRRNRGVRLRRRRRRQPRTKPVLSPAVNDDAAPARRHVTSRADDAGRSPGSTTTRSKRSGSAWERPCHRQRPAVEQPVRRGPDAGALAVVDRLLRQAEAAAARQRTSTTTSAAGGPGRRPRGRARGGRHGRSGPGPSSRRRQAAGDERLGRVARLLRRVRPDPPDLSATHRSSPAALSRPPHLTGHVPRRQTVGGPPPAASGRRVERRVVGHRPAPARARGRSWVSGDADGSPSRSSSSWSPASVRWSARNERRWNGVRPERPDRRPVLARRVALVVLPAVARVAGRELRSSSGRGRPSRRPTRTRSSRPWRRRRRCSCTARPAPRTRRSGCRRRGRGRGRRRRAIARRIARWVAW